MNKKVYGGILILISSILMAGMNLFIKLMPKNFPSSEITFFRFIVGAIIIYIYAKIKNINIKPVRKKYVYLRAIFGGFAILTLIISIKLTTLSQSIVLSNTFPIFSALYLILFFKEKVRKTIWIYLSTSFLGMYLVANPNVVFNMGSIVALLSGMIAGMAIIFIKKARETDNSFTIFFYLSLIGAIISGIPIISVHIMPNLYELTLLVGLSLTGAIGQLLMTYAFKFSSATEAGIITLSTVIFSMLEGVWFFNESISIMMIAGTIFILFSSIMVILPGKEK
jgi:drug/metabolite transporter (DMT)-like permease